MMNNEVYVDNSRQFTLTITSDGSAADADGAVTVDLIEVESGETVESPTATHAGAGTGEYSYNLGLDKTSDPNTYQILWQYTIQGTDVEKSDYVEVVVPYVSLSALRSTFSTLSDKTDEELRFMERTVRGIINGYCSQDFNYELDTTKMAFGKDSEFLQLPDRLYNLTKVELEGVQLYGTTSSGGFVEYLEIVPGDKYLLRRTQNFDDAIKRDIQNVLTDKRYFKENREYEVTGDWGWEYVPNDVNQAAMLLINDYFCNDSKWRERYVSNVRAADWRMEFSKTGDQTTGNANADMLLQRYRNINAVII